MYCMRVKMFWRKGEEKAGWVDGEKKDEQTDGQKDKQTDGWMNRLTEGWTDR